MDQSIQKSRELILGKKGPCRSSLELANDSSKNIQTIAFPAISCGVYGYPWDEAATVALQSVQSHAGTLREVHFILFNDDILQAHRHIADSLFTLPHSRNAPDIDVKGLDIVDLTVDSQSSDTDAVKDL